ncbi:MAG: hypothetical protein EAZ53_05485 [Bacteroidetes bacterium]|nr:MAG: hypothetical protein EAZ53_05485 [Bacteroidota bacterium]
MHKIHLIISLLFSSSIHTIAQSTSSVNEKQSDKNLIVLSNLAQLPIENQEVVLNDEIELRKESILGIKKDNLNIKIEDDKLKMAGFLIKKGGEQIMTGGIVSIVAVGLGLLISVAGASSYRNSSDGAGLQLIGGAIITGGVITGSVLRISGGSNIRKAGRLLTGETLF